jgi:hypothetical protein
MAEISLFPTTLGTIKYSAVFEPEIIFLLAIFSDVLGSYFSNPVGIFNSGSSTNSRLPLPLITTLIVTGSFVFAVVLSMLALI